MGDKPASNLPAIAEADNARLPPLRWIDADTIRRMVSLRHDLHNLARPRGQATSPMWWALTASATGVILATIVVASAPGAMPLGISMALFSGMGAVSFCAAFFIRSVLLRREQFHRTARELILLARRPGASLQFRAMEVTLHVAMLVRRFATLTRLRNQRDALLGEIPDRNFEAAAEFLSNLHEQTKILAEAIGREGGFTTMVGDSLVRDRLNAIQRRLETWIPTDELLGRYLPTTITPEEVFQLFMEIDEQVGRK